MFMNLYFRTYADFTEALNLQGFSWTCLCSIWGSSLTLTKAAAASGSLDPSTFPGLKFQVPEFSFLVADKCSLPLTIIHYKVFPGFPQCKGGCPPMLCQEER